MTGIVSAVRAFGADLCAVWLTHGGMPGVGRPPSGQHAASESANDASIDLLVFSAQPRTVLPRPPAWPLQLASPSAARRLIAACGGDLAAAARAARGFAAAWEHDADALDTLGVPSCSLDLALQQHQRWQRIAAELISQ